MSNNTSYILLISLILPLVFKLLFSIGIIFDLIWDMFNMLQIIANIQNMTITDRPINGLQVLPSCLNVLLFTVDSTVNFKPFENKIVKDQIKKMH